MSGIVDKLNNNVHEKDAKIIATYQRFLWKVFESKSTGDKTSQQLVNKVFTLMEQFAVGKRRAVWKEFISTEGYETLTFMSRIQQQRFVAAHLRGINTYLRNLVPLVHFKGENEC